MTEIAFIVSVLDRPESLRCCLASLALQTRSHSTIVASRLWPVSPPEVYATMRRISEVCSEFHAREIKHPDIDSYRRAEFIVSVEDYVNSEWLCFPCDDSYYVPQMSEIALDVAERNNWDLVYFDILYDPRRTGIYDVMPAHPMTCNIDKMNFLVKRSWFKCFPPDPEHEAGLRRDNWSDGLLIEQLVRDGIRHGKAPGVLGVHN